MEEPSCFQVIEEAWDYTPGGSVAFEFAARLKNVKKNIQIWNREHFGNIQQNIKKLNQNLNHAKNNLKLQDNHSKILEIKNDLEKWYHYEEAFWKTKASDKNLELGDRNTGYFHSTASYRARKLRIDAIKKSDGTWCVERQEIVDTFSSHCAAMATSSKPKISEQIIDLIPSCLLK